MTGKMLPWLIAATVLLLVPGLIYGLAFAPPERYQGDSYRIIYIHVPAASIAMGGYIMMAVAGVVVLVWRMKMAEMVARCLAPIGASFTFICLVTGSIWGKPTWGTWWVWDARLTSMLVLLFLYIGVMALNSAINNAQSAARATAVLSIVGAVNLPIIKYSVNWWNTLHQPASIKMTSSAIDPEMLFTLLSCIGGFYCLFAVLLINSTRCEVLQREQRSNWVKKTVGAV
ncbi:heme ABC transporter permease [Ketobacter sp. MCCC 1A13808]|uniref:heme ABC transporter permease n=1 Tax=Ketobacter sp. MCCC 1A13808 TaxID=2602738 RepID=UPI000F0ED51F|nr:heme ABC transporter permease [Ketobacter sp. MCCC 1A13808]RLP56512.1 MAG: heme ABC transporter permease [Ketobacter sp.]